MFAVHLRSHTHVPRRRPYHQRFTTPSRARAAAAIALAAALLLLAMAVARAMGGG